MLQADSEFDRASSARARPSHCSWTRNPPAAISCQVLLSGSRPRGAEERRLRRFLPHLSLRSAAEPARIRYSLRSTDAPASRGNASACHRVGDQSSWSPASAARRRLLEQDRPWVRHPRGREHTRVCGVGHMCDDEIGVHDGLLGRSVDERRGWGQRCAYQRP